MQNNHVTWLLGFAIVLVCGVCYQVSTVPDAVATAIAEAISKAKEDNMSEITWPSWVHDGETYSLKSVRQVDEETDVFLDRAAAEYSGMRRRFPPN